MKKETVRLIDFNSSTWELMRNNMMEIGSFLSTNERTPLMANLIAMSIKLILSELILRPEEYKKYPSVEYSDEDFVDMVIHSMDSNIPSIDDLNGNEIYFDEFRKIIWGHIKTYSKRLSYILTLMDETGDLREVLTDDDANMFMECLTVSWVECVIRKRETQVLENLYGE